MSCQAKPTNTSSAPDVLRTAVTVSIISPGEVRLIANRSPEKSSSGIPMMEDAAKSDIPSVSQMKSAHGPTGVLGNDVLALHF